MKVGILTFSGAHNFGAQLQCYALQETVREIIPQVQVIDYQPEYLKPFLPGWGWKSVVNRAVLSLASRYRFYRYWKKVYRKYIDFKNRYMNLSQSISTPSALKDVIEGYDVVIVGSDQVWNSQFNGGECDVWYGLLSNHPVWITYAASAGNCSQWLHNIKLGQAILDRFRAISVREESLKSAIENNLLYSGNVPVVLDPSLLANPEIWEPWRTPIVKEKYIIVYQARECDDVFRLAERLKVQTEADKIIVIDYFGNVTRLGYKTYIASPSEFISLVDNAECVVTTSFHGTAFSLLLHTPFYTLFLGDGNDERSKNLLETLNLSNRMIKVNTDVNFEKIDFTESDANLVSLRKTSYEFLKTALKS